MLAFQWIERLMFQMRPNPLKNRPRTASAVITKTSILDAASQLLLTTGIRGVTTNHVAEKAGVSIGSLYQYFSNRDDLLFELLKQVSAARIKRLMETLELSSKQKVLEEFVGVFIDGIFHPNSLSEIHLENLLLPFAVVSKRKSIVLHTREFNDALGPLTRTILISRLPAIAQQKRDVQIVAQVLFAAIRGVAGAAVLLGGPPLVAMRREAKQLLLGYLELHDRSVPRT